MAEDEHDQRSVSRRAFLKGGAIATGALSSSILPTPADAQLPEATALDPRRTTVSLTVNGTPYRVSVTNNTTLLELLRNDLALTGTKMGCDRMQCGACTVIVDGRSMYSVHAARRAGFRRERPDDRGHGERRCPAPDPAGVRRAQWLPVRVLHTRTDHVDQSAARPAAGPDRRSSTAGDGWQPLPLFRLQAHP